jgi:hypothetical protein
MQPVAVRTLEGIVRVVTSLVGTANALVFLGRDDRGIRYWSIKTSRNSRSTIP